MTGMDDGGRAFGRYLKSVDFHYADLVTIGLLVLLEGLLSADNALVLAVLVLGLPKDEQRKALRYGILGAFGFRFLATVFAAYMIGLAWVKLLGALYLLYLPIKHFSGGDAEARRTPKPAKAWLGLTAFWATVVKVELTDIVFAIDSILVAVAMSSKLWVIVTGGLLGILAMRHADRPAAGRGAALSAAGGRRVHHHRVGRASSCWSNTSTRSTSSRSRFRSGCRWD